jgi:Uma2 family endonuclease
MRTLVTRAFVDRREITTSLCGYSSCSVVGHERGTVMETMSTPETILRSNEPIRPLKRVEYEKLGKEGFFDDERVELLFGMVVPMSPIDPAHSESAECLRSILERQLGERARLRSGNPFAASEISEPEPDVMIVPFKDYWVDHPTHAFLVVEVARSSLRKDQGPKKVLYGLAEVDEYWIVNHVENVLEVYRDRSDGHWKTMSRHLRGETIALLAFPDVMIAVTDILPPSE